MIRVSRHRPCPICTKTGWCYFFDDRSGVVCMRIASQHPANGGGHIHWLRDRNDWTPPRRVVRRSSPRPKVQRDWSALVTKFHNAMTDAAWRCLSNDLGLSIETLQAMKVGWDGTQSRYMFPMRNAAGDFVGIRTRRAVPQDDGKDKASFGGDDGNGVFFVPLMLSSDYLIICEGPTDMAALVDAGFGSSIGKPSCKLGDEYVVEIIKRLQPEAVLLVPDADRHGLEGFTILANEILNTGAMPLERIDALTPPKELKDVRKWLQKNRDHLAGRIAGKLEAIKQRSGGSSHDA